MNNICKMEAFISTYRTIRKNRDRPICPICQLKAKHVIYMKQVATYNTIEICVQCHSAIKDNICKISALCLDVPHKCGDCIVINKDKMRKMMKVLTVQ